MGCYNGTCFLSNLPIKHGDKIVIIPIMRKRSSEIPTQISYSDEVFEIAGPTIRGKYNDYGGIENLEENELSVLFFKSIKKNIKNMNINGNENIENLEDFLNNELGGGSLKFNDRPFGFIMMFKDIFNETVGKIKDEFFDEVLESQRNNSLKRKETLEKTLQGEELKIALQAWDEMFGIEIPIGHNYNSYNPIFSTIKKELSSKLEILRETQNFLIFCESTRKLIFPTSGAGSQRDITNSQKNLNNAINKKIMKLNKKLNSI